MNSHIQFRFLPCPICGTETRTKVLRDTLLVRYPMFCAKCRQEILVDVVKMKMALSDAEDEMAGDEGITRIRIPRKGTYPVP